MAVLHLSMPTVKDNDLVLAILIASPTILLYIGPSHGSDWVLYNLLTRNGLNLYGPTPYYQVARCTMNSSTILVFAIASSAIATGCNSNGVDSFYRKHKWNAKDYFTDNEVVILCDAISINDVRKVKDLVASGVNVNAKGKNGMTPLIWAFPANRVEVVRHLLKNKADPNTFIESDFGAPECFEKGDSFTHLACRSFFDYFDDLFDNGGDPHLPHRGLKGEGQTPIFSVIETTGIHAKARIKRLRDLGANITSCVNVTPMSMAFLHDYELCVYLLELGADPFVLDKKFPSYLSHSIALFELSPRPKSQKSLDLVATMISELEKRGENMDYPRADVKRWEQAVLKDDMFWKDERDRIKARLDGYRPKNKD
ncbi:MAG: ankyrin repeat domain-containing protein [Gemmataceae bacterium]